MPLGWGDHLQLRTTETDVIRDIDGYRYSYANVSAYTDAHLHTHRYMNELDLFIAYP